MATEDVSYGDTHCPIAGAGSTGRARVACIASVCETATGAFLTNTIQPAFQFCSTPRGEVLVDTDDERRKVEDDPRPVLRILRQMLDGNMQLGFLGADEQHRSLAVHDAVDHSAVRTDRLIIRHTPPPAR